MNVQEFRDLGYSEDSKDFTAVVKKRGESKLVGDYYETKWVYPKDEIKVTNVFFHRGTYIFAYKVEEGEYANPGWYHLNIGLIDHIKESGGS